MATSQTFASLVLLFLLTGIPSQLNSEISESGGKPGFKLRLWLPLIWPRIDRYSVPQQVVLLAFPLLFLDAFSCNFTYRICYTQLM